EAITPTATLRMLLAESFTTIWASDQSCTAGSVEGTLSTVVPPETSERKTRRAEAGPGLPNPVPVRETNISFVPTGRGATAGLVGLGVAAASAVDPGSSNRAAIAKRRASLATVVRGPSSGRLTPLHGAGRSTLRCDLPFPRAAFVMNPDRSARRCASPRSHG